MTPAQHHLLDQALRAVGIWTTEAERLAIVQWLKDRPE